YVSCSQINQLDRLVRAAGEGLGAVVVKRDAGYAASVGIRDGYDVYIAQSHGLVDTGRKQGAVVRLKRQGPNGSLVIGNCKDFLAACCIEHLNGVFRCSSVANGDPRAVGTEGYTLCGPCERYRQQRLILCKRWRQLPDLDCLVRSG